MEIYNEAKTEELFEPDLEHGYLRPDRLLKEHHEEIPEKVIKTVAEIKEELEAEGKEVRYYSSDDTWCVTLDYTPAHDGLPEGRTVKTIYPVIEPAVPAWDEYEDIQVYHPYTDEEYKDYLRAQRASICFPVINRGAAWYARLTDAQKEELQTWYQAWLDAPETGVKPETPAWV